MDESGKLLRLTGVNLDITQRKQLETVRHERDQLANINKVLMSREERILDMKREVNDLLRELGMPARYGG
jgi:hypothetical protein